MRVVVSDKVPDLALVRFKTKTKPDRKRNAAKAGRRMPHPPSGHSFQTTIPKFYPRLALVPSPLIRAGKIVIYANRIITNYIIYMQERS